MKIISQKESDIQFSREGKNYSISSNILISLIIIIFLFMILLILALIIYKGILDLKKNKIQNDNQINHNQVNSISSQFQKEIVTKNNLPKISEKEINFYQQQLEWEMKLPYLAEINKMRIFEKRYPLPESIKCHEHLRLIGGLQDLMAFTSFLTRDTIFFEFGSGCTSMIAKYYTKKSYSVEGNKKWYEHGIKNGLNIILKDIKPDGRGLWCTPGTESTLEDWKQYFQAYKKEYNANLIFIDGRFRVACALDIFGKINDDTLVLIHEFYRVILIKVLFKIKVN